MHYQLNTLKSVISLYIIYAYKCYYKMATTQLFIIILKATCRELTSNYY